MISKYKNKRRYENKYYGENDSSSNYRENNKPHKHNSKKEDFYYISYKNENKNKNRDKNYYEIEEYDYYNKNYNDYKYSENKNKKSKKSIKRKSIGEDEILNIQKPNKRTKSIDIGNEQERKNKNLKKKISNYDGQIRNSRVLKNYKNNENKKQRQSIIIQRNSKTLQRYSSRNYINIKKEDIYQLSSDTIKKLNLKCSICKNQYFFIYIPKNFNPFNIKELENDSINNRKKYISSNLSAKTDENLIKQSSIENFYPILVCLKLHQFCCICHKNPHPDSFCDNIQLDSRIIVYGVLKILEKDIPEDKKEIFLKMKKYSLTKISDNYKKNFCECECKCCKNVSFLSYILMGLCYFGWTIVSIGILIGIFLLIIILLIVSLIYWLYLFIKNTCCSNEKTINNNSENENNVENNNNIENDDNIEKDIDIENKNDIGTKSENEMSNKNEIDENNNSSNKSNKENNKENVVQNENEDEIIFTFIWWDKVKDLFDYIPKGYSWISNKFKSGK